MQIAFTEEQDALRKELRVYFADLMTQEVQDEMAAGDGEYGSGELYKRLVRQMGQRRLARDRVALRVRRSGPHRWSSS